MTKFYLRRYSDGEIVSIAEVDDGQPPPVADEPTTHFYQREDQVPPHWLERYEQHLKWYGHWRQRP